MALAKILWVDDEIESLQSQKIFLQNKGYDVQTLTNGFDAIDYVKENIVDVVLLDETMPGITGLETLSKIKEVNAQIPVVLITKNETENLMDEAIGSQISDYLIKPVNPNQVWLSLKKIIDNRRLVAERTTTAYQQQFRNLFMALKLQSGLQRVDGHLQRTGALGAEPAAQRQPGNAGSFSNPEKRSQYRVF
jgi:DNA-binding NtrC family response regulator